VIVIPTKKKNSSKVAKKPNQVIVKLSQKTRKHKAPKAGYTAAQLLKKAEKEAERLQNLLNQEKDIIKTASELLLQRQHQKTKGLHGHLMGGPTGSQLFVKRIKNQARANNQLVREQGLDKTPSQLFRLTTKKRSLGFRPTLLGGLTGSGLLNRSAKVKSRTANDKVREEPMVPTSSQLFRMRKSSQSNRSYKDKKRAHFFGGLTASQLSIANDRTKKPSPQDVWILSPSQLFSLGLQQHKAQKFRPQLYAGKTASQLAVATDRVANRVANDLIREQPIGRTASQLFYTKLNNERPLNLPSIEQNIRSYKLALKRDNDRVREELLFKTPSQLFNEKQHFLSNKQTVTKESKHRDHFLSNKETVLRGKKTKERELKKAVPQTHRIKVGKNANLTHKNAFKSNSGLTSSQLLLKHLSQTPSKGVAKQPKQTQPTVNSPVKRGTEEPLRIEPFLFDFELKNDFAVPLLFEF